MSASNKILQAAAGNAAGAAVYVEDVFSTFLYEGNQTARSINNGLDLSGEGGLVWLKNREQSQNNYLFDTENGANKFVLSDNTAALQIVSDRGVTAFNSNGFDLGTNTGGNRTGYDYVSWSFRKQAGFFDVVTYTGNGTAGRTVSHNLGSKPGFILTKNLSNSADWAVYHRSMTADYYSILNGTDGFYDNIETWNDTEPTATEFTVGDWERNNTNGDSYVAYLFAHDDQSFGDGSDEAIIKCGSYTGNGNADGPEVNLGFEPQFLLVKNTSGGNWVIADVMRSFGLEDMASLYPNSSNAESTIIAGKGITPTATGFKCIDGNATTNQNTETHIYIAIRRPMKTPEAGTEVFAASYNQEVASATSGFYSGFPVDLAIKRIITASQPNYLFDRLRGAKSFTTNANSAEGGFGAAEFDHQEGFYYDDDSSNTNDISWMFKRATGFLDVVAYSGNGTSGRSITHNLGVTPELMIIKKRNGVGVWQVAHKDVWGSDKSLYLNLDSAAGSGTFSYYFYQAPTSSVFYVTNQSSVNGSGDTFVAYLFATVAGVSKVGSYTGTGSDQNIDCGFSSGARFVLIKRTDSSANWNLYDSIEQGIVAGNDPHIFLNTNGAQETSDDKIDPYSAGFTVVGSHGHVNASSGEYIFLAIA